MTMSETKASVFALQFNRPETSDPEGPSTTSAADLKAWSDAPVIHELRELLEKGPGTMQTHFSEPDPKGFFREEGSVAFKGGSRIEFGWSDIPGKVYESPAGEPYTPGAIVWTVTGGDGIFKGATGTITSNFLVNLKTYELIDNHVYVLFLPG